MTTEQNKIESSGQAPVQKELELDMEPITPKRHPTPKPTLLEKSKSIFSGLGKKSSTNETNFSMRKEPTIASQTTNIETEQKTQETAIPVITIGNEQNIMIPETQEQKTTTDAEKNEAQSTSEEPIKTVQENLTKPENWSVLGALPPKYRRIFIALLIAVLVLLIISWLKPSSDVVQSFEQPKGNTIPTQFQSLDQSQPAEPTILDKLNNPQPQTKVATTSETTTETNTPTPTETKETDVIVSPATEQATTQTIMPNVKAPSQTPSIVEQEKVEPTKVEQEKNIATVQPAPKVISETAAEQPKAQNKPRAVEKPKFVEKTKPVEKPKNSEKSKIEKKGAPVIDAKPANTAKSQKPVAQTNKASKTLVVPQGTSLMQVFRNNNLNISDVNAMTKASGAGNALSSFKPGDKVQVSLNSQGRVNELRLSNGARFIRQADGSYQFKK
ncbi:opacity associated protein A [Canicola haemoglobinophilus]|uniref:Opacity associated protein A n=1 Tax=Canicola haemoglobinophilus TaxID=733 RepID=A0A377HVM0_9PAST|nr:opacity-associated protein OapA [Canicola haemoglobinophilus]STO59969.1 opacity associated protein A [Canicola haemoglobinophilus]